MVTQVVDWLLIPLAKYPFAALILSAVALAFLAARLLGLLTPRLLLVRLTKQTQAELLAIRLFADQPGNLVRSLCCLSWLGILRIACFVPGGLILIPLGIVATDQLEMRFAWRPLKPGEDCLVIVEMDPATWKELSEVKLSCEGPIQVTSGPLHDEGPHRIFWKIERGLESMGNAAQLQFNIAGHSIELPLQLERRDSELQAVQAQWPAYWWKRLSPSGSNTWTDKAHFRSVSLEYPAREYSFAGIGFSWWVPCVVAFSLAAWIFYR